MKQYKHTKLGHLRDDVNTRTDKNLSKIACAKPNDVS